MGTTPSSLASSDTGTITKTSPTTSSSSGTVHAYCCRLNPGDDLVPSLLNAASTALAMYPMAGSAFIMTAVGSLQDVKLRMASASSSSPDQKQHVQHRKDERFEVVSLVGTFTSDGKSKHLHMSISDAKGNTLGGHLISGIVYTTLELVIGTVCGIQFDRQYDSKTGYTELVVKRTDADTNKSTIPTTTPSSRRSMMMVSPSPSLRLRSSSRGSAVPRSSMPTSSLLSPSSLQNVSARLLQRVQKAATQTADPIKVSAKRCKQELERLKTKWTPHKAGAGRSGGKFQRPTKKKM